MKIPFKFLPSAWGLKGETRKIAEIEYMIDDPFQREVEIAKVRLEGKDLNRELVRIEFKYGHLTSMEHDLQMLHYEGIADETKRRRRELDIRMRHGSISEYDYNLQYATCIEDETDKELAVLKVKLDAGKMTETEYAKEVATIRDEPWVAILDMTVNKENPSLGSWELDWNSKFIELIEGHGFIGASEEESVNDWLNHLCKEVALEAFDGIGDINERLEGISVEERETLPDETTLKDGRYFRG
jgi:hypothetical protein